MNVPYPGFSDHYGFITALLVMLLTGVILYWIFRRRDWILSGGRTGETATAGKASAPGGRPGHWLSAEARPFSGA
jgi:hypothetical protein